MSDQENPNGKPPRRRGLTSVTLQWIAEKFRKAQNIKEQLAKGTYEVESDKIARAMINNGEGERK